MIDRSLTPTSGVIVLALLGAEFTIKRYRVASGRIVLEPENPVFEPLPVTEEMGLEIWGVVKHSIRML